MGATSLSASDLYDAIGVGLQENRLEAASGMARDMAARFPDFAKGRLACAQVAVRSGRLDEAAAHAIRAAALEPADPLINATAARILARAGLFEDATRYAMAVLESKATDARLFDIAGYALTLCGGHESARDCFARAVELAPANAAFAFNLAATERFLGNLDAAEGSFARAIEIDPDHCEAHYGLSMLGRGSRAADLRAVLARGAPDWRGEVQLRYALGQELERAEAWVEAFDVFAQGAALKRKHTRYDLKAETEAIDQIIAAHTPEALAKAPPGAPNGDAIFVVGLPRTGSTLVDRIIGSHPDVVSKGELNDFTAAFLSAYRAGYPDAPRTRADLVRNALSLDMEALGEDYLRSARQRFPRGGRFVDKMPLNGLYLGLIAKALPNASIVLVERDPMDTAAALYTSLFEHAYAWSYDLGEIGEYMNAHHRLMQHWRATLGDRVCAVSYEQLVRDQEAQTHTLLQHCGLPWRDACLRFFDNPAPCATASAVQIRKPIYSSSIGRWKRYEQRLDGVRERLAPLVAAYARAG